MPRKSKQIQPTEIAQTLETLPFAPRAKTASKTLDEICGIVDRRYKQKTEADYKDFLKSLTTSDIMLHCQELNLPHFGDRSVNLENLALEFRKHNQQKKVSAAALEYSG